MPECITLTLHIFRNALEDGSILFRIGERQFRLYERKQLALVQERGCKHRRLPAIEAAELFRLLDEIETLSTRWSVQ